MFYEEQVIKGILCWRSTPNGEWMQKTPEQLTTLLIDARYENVTLYEQAAGASL